MDQTEGTKEIFVFSKWTLTP